MATTQDPPGGGQEQTAKANQCPLGQAAFGQSSSQSPFAQPFGQIGRPMEDAVFVALVTALLSTVVQSLMSHTSNSSANHQAALSNSANTHSATLAILARAADQILSGGPAPVATSAAPHQAAPPMDYFSNTNRVSGPAGYGMPPVVT